MMLSKHQKWGVLMLAKNRLGPLSIMMLIKNECTWYASPRIGELFGKNKCFYLHFQGIFNRLYSGYDKHPKPFILWFVYSLYLKLQLNTVLVVKHITTICIEIGKKLFKLLRYSRTYGVARVWQPWKVTVFKNIILTRNQNFNICILRK